MGECGAAAAKVYLAKAGILLVSDNLIPYNILIYRVPIYLIVIFPSAIMLMGKFFIHTVE